MPGVAVACRGAATGIAAEGAAPGGSIGFASVGGGSIATGTGVTGTGLARGAADTGVAVGITGMAGCCGAVGTTGIARGGVLPDRRLLEDSEFDIRGTFLGGFMFLVGYQANLNREPACTTQV